MSVLTLGAFLSNKVYYVPFGQRPYSWEVDEVTSFCEAINALAVNNYNRWYINGVVVLNNEDGKSYLYDGQQRICTTLIIVSNVCKKINSLLNEVTVNDELNNLSEDDLESMRDNRSSYKIHYLKDGDNYKFHPYEDDVDFFRKYIQNMKPLDEDAKSKKTESNVRLYEAYCKVSEFLDDKLSSYTTIKDKYVYLKNFADSMLSKMELVEFVTSDTKEAKMIFNSINNTGKKLKDIDILKNLLILNYGEDYIKPKWKELSQTISESDTTQFLRYFLQMRESTYLGKNLSKKLDNIIDNNKSEGFVDDLLKGARIYRTLKSGDGFNYFTGKYSGDIKSTIKQISSVNKTASGYFPVILAMGIRNFGEEEILDVIKLIEIYFVRNYCIGNTENKELENNYNKLAYKIYNDNISAKDIALKLKEHIGSKTNTTVKQDLLNLQPNDNLAAYLLRKICNYKSGSEIMAVEDKKKLNVEHIMPKDNDIWKVDKEIHSTYCKRFGNLTLLGEKMNKSIKHDVFSVKKEKYKKSAIALTSELANMDEWGVREIDDRQNFYAETMLEIWNLELEKL